MINIIPIRHEGKRIEFLSESIQNVLLKNHLDGHEFVDPAIGDAVKRRSYCVFLSENRKVPNAEEQTELSKPKYAVHLVTGKAAVIYDIRTRKTEAGLVETIIRLKSDTPIDGELSGYTYQYHGTKIDVPFPGMISTEKVEYPAIYLEEGVKPTLAVVGTRKADISFDQKKISFWKKDFWRFIKQLLGRK
jgi:hypothetical protein